MNRDNQQETVRDVELAWLAGFLDSDGSVQMTIPRTSRGTKQRVVNLWIDFSNSDAGIILKAHDILERMNIGFHTAQKFVRPIYKENGEYYLPNKKICLAIRIGKIQHIDSVLTALMPYMAGTKKHLSEIIVRFCRRRLTRGRQHYDEQDLLVIREFFSRKDGKYAAAHLPYLDGLLRDFTPSPVETSHR